MAAGKPLDWKQVVVDYNRRNGSRFRSEVQLMQRLYESYGDVRTVAQDLRISHGSCCKRMKAAGTPFKELRRSLREKRTLPPVQEVLPLKDPSPIPCVQSRPRRPWLHRLGSWMVRKAG